MHRLWTQKKGRAISPAGRDTPPLGPRRGAGLDRDILALAVPALGALAAQPIFVLIDSAIVGRLGTAELAGLSLASTVLTTITGLCVFLAYATTASVARKVGAGRQREALELGFDGVYLALLLGAILALALLLAAPMTARALGADGDVAIQATSYLRSSAPGLPGMLVVLAATGAMRGVQDTRSTLWVASGGAIVNSGLNFALVYGAHLGIAGSGLGTAITETAMGLVLVAILIAKSRGTGISLRPRPGGIVAGARDGIPLFLRTLALRLAILATVRVAVSLGDVQLAANQIINAMWGLAAYAMDALAIAAQALIGKALGARDAGLAEAVRARTVRWGIGAGAFIAVVFAAGSQAFPQLFSTDPAVQRAAGIVLLVTAATMPLAGYVYVLDGVLMGASDAWFLAAAGVITLAVYLPLLWLLHTWAPRGTGGLAMLWVGYAIGFIGVRAATNGWRARGTRWLGAAAG